MWYATWQMRYLAARLAWDVTADYTSLVDEMGTKYYGQVWPVMKEYRKLLTMMYENTPGHICYGTPAHVYGKCLEKPGVEARLLQLLANAETAAADNALLLKRVKRDHRYFQTCWQVLHQDYLANRQQELHAEKRTDRIVIDAKLDENNWRKVQATGNFVVFDGKIGAGKTAAAPQTFVKMLYDQDNIYFAVEAMESEPGKMKINATKRDGPVWSDSSLEFFITASGMASQYGHVIVNPNGVFYDSKAVSGSNADITFDCQAEIKTAIFSDRWVAELRIPAAAFGRSIDDGEAWKINVARNRRLNDGQKQCSSWSNGVFHGPEAFRSVIFGKTALLTNGDFEDAVEPNKHQKKTAWTFASATIPLHWAFHSGQAGTATLIDGDAASGSRCLRIKDGWIHQKINQAADYRNDLVIRGKVRGQGVLTIAMYYYDRETQKNIPGKTLKTIELNSTEWTAINAVHTCENDNILRLAFWIKGEIDLDDISVSQETNREVAPLN